jgi:uridine kinase
MSAAGKSTLAEQIKRTSKHSCNVFHMDDFFLQPFQRTPDRLSEPGGNIDYERFDEEIITPLRAGISFSYRSYDCRSQKLSAPILVDPSPVSVIEGVYSLHPRFSDAYDIKVFLGITADEQRRRLFERNPNLFDRFVHEWIPMENKYFEYFSIPDICDLTFII